MDNLMGIIIGGATGALAKETVTTIIHTCRGAVERLAKAKNPAALRARQHTLEFLGDLARRLDVLEQKAGDLEGLKRQVRSALDDPAFVGALYDALDIASRLKEAQSRETLARLIIEGLSCNNNSLVALSIPRACQTLKYLTPDQLRILATSATLQKRLPVQLQQANTSDVETSTRQWLMRKLGPVLPIGDVTRTDLVHLESCSCIHLNRSALCDRSLEGQVVIYTKNNDPRVDRAIKTFIVETDVGRRLQSLWAEVFLNVDELTSIGQVLGISVSNDLTADHVTLDVCSGWP